MSKHRSCEVIQTNVKKRKQRRESIESNEWRRHLKLLGEETNR